jgi:hydroxypyruvate reductase/glycerate 2-kinase
VRKHLSYLKGGRAAKIAEAKIYAYIVSDVIGDDLSTIASGLTAPDNTTFEDAISVLNKYNVNDEIVLDILKHPERYSLSETVKPDEFPNERVKNIIVCKNSDAIAAAAKKANELGLNAISLGTIVAGEAKTEALRLYSYLENAHEHTAIISGGEPIVKVKGNGKGGRNQEFVLSLVNLLKKGEIVASVGTDGIDGPTDAAGAVADWTTMDRARKLNIDPLYYLANNDSYSFFEKVNGLIKTGPTGTNVMDVQIMIKL